MTIDAPPLLPPTTSSTRQPRVDASQQLLDRASLRLLTPEERPLYTTLMSEHHYLKSDLLVGEQLRYVVEADGVWLALLSWSAAAYHLLHREQWIGWTTAQRRRRLALVANNSRFLILPGLDCPNLASKSLGLCLARLSADWQDAYQHPILVVETFVDSQLFRGTSYKAQGWTLLGQTKGFERCQQDYYTAHDRPKQLWVKELASRGRGIDLGGASALEVLRAATLPAVLQPVEDKIIPQPSENAKEMGALWEMCREIPDWRKRKGRDYPLATILAIMVMAVLCGVVHGQRDLAAFANKLTQAQRRNLRCYRNPRGTYDAPKETTFQRILAQLDADVFEKVLLRWEAMQLGKATRPGVEHGGGGSDIIAIDGKSQRGSATANKDDQKPQLVSAYSLPEGRVLGTVLVDKKSNEIPAARELLAKIGPQDGKLLMADSMHCQRETIRQATQENGLDYLLPVKDNQGGLVERVAAEFEALPTLPQPPITKASDNESQADPKQIQPGKLVKSATSSPRKAAGSPPYGKSGGQAKRYRRQ